MDIIRVVRASVPVLLVLFCMSSGENALEITTKSGKVRGFVQSTAVGKDIVTFLGVPYGACTGGENRFGPPKEVKPWEGTLDAITFSKPCYQIIGKKFKDDVLASSEEETEDCLKLNIWAPLNLGSSGKRAVLVWIHGGGFSCGSSNLPLYNGAVMAAQEDVLVVSMNYRLSGFGFFYLGHPLAPGNVGLMDQALAMKWVKNNIEAFGGDPERVTIFGESAGGASVGLQLLAPTSLDLFNNAILQSGTSAHMWAAGRPEEAVRKSLHLAEMAGCPTNENNREETIRCLQGLTAESLSEMMLKADEDSPPMVTYFPVIDGSFLPSHPLDLLKNGKFCEEKNVLVGFTKEDGAFFIPYFVPHLKISEESVLTEEEIRRIILSNTGRNGELTDLQLSMVEHMYTDWDSTPQDRISARQQLIHFFTDRWMGCGALEFADRMSDRGNKVFLYRFDHVLENQTSFIKVPRWMGSIHGDEFPFVFGHALKNNDDDEAKLAKKVMRYWANFARQGNPNDGYQQEWPVYTTESKMRLQIDGKALTVDKTDRLRECAFWKHVFPKTEL